MSLSVMLICEVISLLNSFCTLRSRRSCAFRSSTRHLARVQLLLKFFLRVRRLQLVELRLDVGIDRHQAQLLGALQHDFVVDQRAQHFQLLNQRLIAARTLPRRPAELRLDTAYRARRK